MRRAIAHSIEAPFEIEWFCGYELAAIFHFKVGSRRWDA